MKDPKIGIPVFYNEINGIYAFVQNTDYRRASTSSAVLSLETLYE